MGTQGKCLDTLWETPDELWARIEPILQAPYPPKPTGRPRADFRKCLEAMIFILRTNCPWNRLPKRFGDDSTVHRWFQRWCRDGILDQIWAILVGECQDLGEVDWSRQAADSSMGKARFGGPGRPESDRSRQKRHEKDGVSGRPRGTVGCQHRTGQSAR